MRALRLGLALVILLVPHLRAISDTQVSGTVSTSATWTLAGSPYLVTGDVLVEGGSSPVLTIEPGVTVKFASGTGLFVGYGDTGGLQAVGTSANPITFTSNDANPASGSWRCIGFSSLALPTSHLAHATVTWAGSYENTGIYIDRSSPTLENLMVANSSGTGITVTGAGASPTISSTSLTDNSGVGLNLTDSATASLTGLTTTGNGGFAISQDPGITLSAASGLVAQGNGVDAIELRNGFVATTTTWKKTELPYVSTGYLLVADASSPVLTIEPGVTVKFASETGLFVGWGGPGGLHAVGTPASPITFTSSDANPSPGLWRCIHFTNNALSTSRLAYATVTWAGSYENAGVYVDGSSPAIDNVTISHSSGAGITVTGAEANPTLSSATLTNNATAGISIEGGSPFVTGSLIQANARTGIVVIGGNPVIQATTVSGTTAGDGWSGNGIDLRGGSASVNLSTISGNAAAGVSAGGGAGHVVQNCVFSGNAGGAMNDIPANRVIARLNYWDSASGPSGQGFGSGQPVSSGVIFDPWLTAPPNLSEYVAGLLLVGPRFNPLAAPARWNLSSSTSGTWTLSIRDPGQNLIRTLGSTGTPTTLSWDGKDGGGTLQPDATYTYLLEIVSGLGAVAAPASGRLYLDTSMDVSIASPGATETLSNVYSSGQLAFPVSGTVALQSLTEWILEYGSGGTPSSWTSLASGTNQVADATFAIWDTAPLSNGPYTIRLTAFDSLDNPVEVCIHPTVGHFSVSSDRWEFDPRASETVSYTSIVPFPLSLWLYTKNSAGQTIRTLTNAQRDAGTYTEAWDGRNDGSALVPDGLYSVIAEVTDGTHSLTYDLSADFVDLGAPYGLDGLTIPSYDPFAGSPMTLTYKPWAPGRVTVIFSTTPRSQGAIVGSCTTPTEFCILDREFRSSQSQTITWSGVDLTGRYRSDARQVAIFIESNQFPKNGVVVYGSPIAISNMSLSPARVRPGIDNLQIDFDLALSSGDTATVAIAFVNQESLSPLRTITLTGRSAGHHTATWDGLADNGSRVAEGNYLVDVSATDSSGNKRSAQLLTVLQY